MYHPTHAAVLPGLCLAAFGLTALPLHIRADENSFNQIQRGRYLTTVGDCTACHTAPNGEYMAGGRPVPTPFGTIYSANLTPDVQTGLGAWNSDQFVRAMREGINAEGNHLYPAFPYPYFTKTTREDLMAIWSYLQTIEPVSNAEAPTELIGPLDWRQLMTGWKMLFFEPGVYEPNPKKSAQWNRGAYLVEGLGHCGACHTPRNFFGGANKSAPYTGSELQQWHAPDLTADPVTGLGDWTKEDIVEYLKTGTNGEQFAGGLMQEVIENSTQHMTRDDLEAIAIYLKDLPDERQAASSEEEEEEEEQPADESEQDAQSEGDLGRALYVDNCTGCHRYNGKGMQDVFPELAGSPIVQANDPTSLIHVVLRGASEPNTETRPNRLSMPPFDWKLDDDQIAAVLSYIRSAWGNDAPPVDSETVEEVREATQLDEKL
nr:cytochrome c [uncultured Halomonas sp.]